MAAGVLKTLITGAKTAGSVGRSAVTSGAKAARFARGGVLARGGAGATATRTALTRRIAQLSPEQLSALRSTGYAAGGLAAGHALSNRSG